MKFIKWIFRIFIVIIFIVLALNNKELVKFNLFNIYSFQSPLIVIVALSIFIGVVIGLFVSWIYNVKRKFTKTPAKKL